METKAAVFDKTLKQSLSFSYNESGKPNNENELKPGMTVRAPTLQQPVRTAGLFQY